MLVEFVHYLTDGTITDIMGCCAIVWQKLTDISEVFTEITLTIEAVSTLKCCLVPTRLHSAMPSYLSHREPEIGTITVLQF